MLEDTGTHIDTDVDPGEVDACPSACRAPAENVWLSVTDSQAPSARYALAAVWTGSEVLVWGGAAPGATFGDGYRYDPSSDTWTPISNTGAPSPRRGHTAVWTGSEMIVWGGSEGTAFSNGGARYDPGTDQWSSIASAPIVGRMDHVAVWSGAEMIILGGRGSNSTPLTGGARYNPSTNLWTNVSPSGAPAVSSGFTATWADMELIVWGGVDVDVDPVLNGGRYDPVSDQWSPMAASDWRRDHVAVWTGCELLVWGGSVNDAVLNTGGRYDPVADVWGEPFATDGAPEARMAAGGVWTGCELIVWGGTRLPVGGPGTPLATGGAYDPVSDQWRVVSTVGAPSSRSRFPMLWTGDEVFLWGGNGGGLPAVARGNGGRYLP